jgi:uncharacterized protein Usg
MDQDFKKIIFDGSVLVSINVIYHLPDYENLINHFYWQTLDIRPTYPRVKRFLKFWRKEIDARIKEVIVSDEPHIPNIQWRNGILLNID